MEVTQIYEIMNNVTNAVLGKTDLVKEDLSNIVTVGDEIFNARAVDNYVAELVDHIGKVIFVNRPYRGSVPSVLMDGWEFGSVLEKIRADIPEAEENESWKLEDRKSYDPNIFYKPKVSVKFFNNKSSFQVPMSFTRMQVKESFSNVEQLNGFLSMLYDSVDKSMTIKMDSLVRMTINSMTAQTLFAEYATAQYGSSSGVRAVNLLLLYNQRYGKTLAAEEAVTDPDFIRFAAYEIGVYSSRLTQLSTLFNIGNTAKFTPKDLQHVVMLDVFVKATEVFLQSNTYHETLVNLPNAEVVPYWQSSGTRYDFDDISGIDVTIAKEGGGTQDVAATGILAVIFDRDALGVTNLNRRVESNYNPVAEFYSNWHKFDAGYFNDLNENFVVFFVADPT